MPGAPAMTLRRYDSSPKEDSWRNAVPNVRSSSPSTGMPRTCSGKEEAAVAGEGEAATAQREAMLVRAEATGREGRGSSKREEAAAGQRATHLGMEGHHLEHPHW